MIVIPIRSMQTMTLEMSIANCPFSEGCRYTLHIYREAAREAFFKCFGCGEEGYATPTDDGGFQLRVQTFHNVPTTETSRIARP